MAGLGASTPLRYSSPHVSSTLPTRHHLPLRIYAGLEASRSRGRKPLMYEESVGLDVHKKKGRKPVVFEEEIYNIDTGPELSTKKIIELAGVHVPKRLAQQLQQGKKQGKATTEKGFPPERKTHKLLKVIAGKASGKKLLSVADMTVRPMMEVVRGAVFDILQARLHGVRSFSSGCSWLDLYSGTGSVGIEALSRGCTSAHFVEMDPWIVTNVLQRNVESANLKEQTKVHVMKTEAFLEQASRLGRELVPFDYISVTPPYEAVDYNVLMDQLSSSSVLGKDTFVVVEYPSEVAILANCGKLQKILNRRYGRTHVAIYGPEWALKT